MFSLKIVQSLKTCPCDLFNRSLAQSEYHKNRFELTENYPDLQFLKKF